MQVGVSLGAVGLGCCFRCPPTQVGGLCIELAFKRLPFAVHRLSGEYAVLGEGHLFDIRGSYRCYWLQGASKGVLGLFT